MDASDSLFCTECGKSFDSENLLRYQGHMVCAECKPVFAQRVRQGASLYPRMEYGGFWIRFAARLIDGIIIGGLNFTLSLLLAAYTRNVFAAVIVPVFGLLAVFIYDVWFIARLGATPGKMVFQLRVVTENGGRISTGRAIARYFGYWLDSLTLAIGYVIAAFDDQKRALHDHLCGTRVIKDEAWNPVAVV
jgi:uncharacterized RDD family membrane protein YckC